jgi:hypothetical protein
MIKITLNQIKAHNPCEDGWAEIQAANHLHGGDYDKPFPLSAALDTNGLSDVLWSLRCLPEHNSLWRKYAVWCARQAQHLMTDQRNIDALDVAWRHSDGLATDEELAAASAAAWDAASAAAWPAAWDARVARVAAWAAARVARPAAWDARVAAWAAQEEKLREILTAGEWV